MDHRPVPSPPIAQTLRAAISDQASVTVATVVRACGDRAMPLLLILVNLPNVVFAPPVLAGIAAFPTAMVGVQMMLGRDRLWLPEGVLGRSVTASALRRLLERTGPWLDRLEAVGRVRLSWAAGAGARRMLGVFAVLAAIIVLLPVPGTNVLPALAVIVMAMATLRMDGMLFLIGAALGLAGVLVACLAAGFAVEMVRWAWRAWGS